ncbi:diguanylate cyclase [Parashewanella spongiae]|uniref:Diguanylate cyclase n=1 Tax=Parashewanella spongiae TaxID=342950 RepID=A0A3A6TS47_9GAMM|nr:PAS domain-containing protein [Parashewanella spongiae]MCL1076935.1 diguanylate cyclase [Parashewanella spongiae]RJY18948.1 diguanylate cyclase [Parashewanella spongiae]
MLKHGSIPQLKSLLFAGQSIHWSYQRKLAVASQILMLLLGVLLLVSIVITVGERRLQNDWATQRYSELQTLGTLLSDKVAFQEFRTRTFSQSEVLTDYLEKSNDESQQKLIGNWLNLSGNIPELLDIALIGPSGKLLLSTSNNFPFELVPQKILRGQRSLGSSDIYTSSIYFAPIDGVLEPYFYQVAWLENTDMNHRGFLITYSSVSRILQSIRPDLGMKQSPLIMLDTLGTVYAGSSGKPSLIKKAIDDDVGSSLSQNYPMLWREITLSKFGQFNGQNATFVYLKLDLTADDQTKRNYFLVSYLQDKDVKAKFEHWKSLLIFAAVCISLMGIVLILLSHLFRLERRAKLYNIELVESLFNGKQGNIIATDRGRVISANSMAAKTLNISKEELSERSLQRIFHLEFDSYVKIMDQFNEHMYWTGEIDLRPYGGNALNIQIVPAPDSHRREHSECRYVLVTFYDISELSVVKEQNQSLTQLANSAVAVALTDTKGTLLNTNQQFNERLKREGCSSSDMKTLLGSEVESQWLNIQQQLSLKGQWQGRYDDVDIHIDQAVEADADKWICTLIPSADNGFNGSQKLKKIPHRSAVLVNYVDVYRYFEHLDNTKRLHSSMMLIDITPTGVFSHMSDIDKLEKRQQDVEMHLLLELPKAYQLAKWQVGRLMIILPNTSADEAHQFAVELVDNLNNIGLAEGICVGIAAYHKDQALEQFIDNTEVALKRAKQNGEHNICQAFTRYQTDDEAEVAMS